MATKSSSSSKSSNSNKRRRSSGARRDLNFFIQLAAFVAVMLAAILGILQMCGVGGGALTAVKEIALLIGVVFTGYRFACTLRPSTVWKVLYIVAAVLCLLGAVFGGFVKL